MVAVPPRMGDLRASPHPPEPISSPDLRPEDFRLLVDAVEDFAILTLDPRGIIRSWNPGAQRMKGYTRDEAIGRHFSMLYPPDALRRGEPMKNLGIAADVGRFRAEGLRVRKSGELFLADVLIVPIRDERGL